MPCRVPISRAAISVWWNRHRAIANRFTAAVKVSASAQREADDEAARPHSENEPTVLEDFMLQAEIFLQYSMRSKAVERLQRIQKLFPREEDRNEKLRSLYMNAGMMPKYDDAPPAKPAVEKEWASLDKAALVSRFGDPGTIDSVEARLGELGSRHDHEDDRPLIDGGFLVTTSWPDPSTAVLRPEGELDLASASDLARRTSAYGCPCCSSQSA